jgi:hypothetical protein
VGKVIDIFYNYGKFVEFLQTPRESRMSKPMTVLGILTAQANANPLVTGLPGGIQRSTSFEIGKCPTDLHDQDKVVLDMAGTDGPISLYADPENKLARVKGFLGKTGTTIVRTQVVLHSGIQLTNVAVNVCYIDHVCEDLMMMTQNCGAWLQLSGPRPQGLISGSTLQGSVSLEGKLVCLMIGESRFVLSEPAV